MAGPVSPYGGVEPNFVAQQSGDMVNAGMAPLAQGQNALNWANPGGLAGMLNEYLAWANAPGVAQNINSTMYAANAPGALQGLGTLGSLGLNAAGRIPGYEGMLGGQAQAANPFQAGGALQNMIGQYGGPQGAQAIGANAAGGATAPGTLQALGGRAQGLASAYDPQGLASGLAGQQAGAQHGAGVLSGIAGGSANPLIGEMKFSEQMANQGTNPFLTGNVGDIASSPTMQAAMRSWEQNVKPVVQQQMQLAGLGRSAATAGALGESANTAMLPILQNEFANRLQASQQAAGLYGQQAGAGANMANTQSQAAQALQNAGLNAAGLRQSGIGQAMGLESQVGQALQQGGLNAAGLQQQGLLGATGQQQNTALQANQAAGQLGLAQQQAGQQAMNQQVNTGLQAAGQQQQGIGQAANLQSQGALGWGNLLSGAAQGGLGALNQGLGLEQQGLGLAANIANQEAQRAINAGTAGSNALLGLSQPLGQAANWYQQQQQGFLGAGGQAGAEQQSTQQGAFDAQQADYLRRQSLGEAGTTGLFGGSVLPKTIQTSSSTTGGK